MIGSMRHQVKIQSQSRSADSGGSSDVTFSDVATVNASIKPLAGGDRFFGDQIEERITHMMLLTKTALNMTSQMVAQMLAEYLTLRE